MAVNEGLAADMLTIIKLLERIAEAVEKISDTIEEATS